MCGVLYDLSGITAVKKVEFVTCDHLLSCRIKLVLLRGVLSRPV